MGSTSHPRAGACPAPEGRPPQQACHAAESAPWRAAGLRYFAHSFFLRRHFGGRVHRISVDIGLSCPNVDGTVALGGCVFCDNRSFSPSRRSPRRPITAQLDEGIRRLAARYRCHRFLAYFQPGSNTYAPADRLRDFFNEAASHRQVVGVAVGTRPDCVPAEVLDVLEQLGQRTYVSVEYGLQTIHDEVLDWMNRGHHFDAFVDAVTRSRGRGFSIGTHVILGLPGESREQMLATAREVAHLEIDSIKIHNLYAVKRTPLAQQVARGEVRLLELDEYASLVVDFLELLPPSCVIERLSGDAPDAFLVGPHWCRNRAAVRTAIDSELLRRDSCQGRLYRSPG